MHTIQYQDPFSRFEHPMMGRDHRPYFAEEGLLAAANAALALERPLLLTGEPGCGKTDFAFAAASGLCGDSKQPGYKPLEFYVRSGTTATDLLYRYDSVRRFSDAQGGAISKARSELPQNYIFLEALGQGLISPLRRVVLIDEIDKAQRDLPNDLLRELDQGNFDIPEIDIASDTRSGDVEVGHQHLRRLMARPDGSERPLVIITSNVERQLPEAFLRRCLFYYVPFPDSTQLLDILEGQAPAGTDAAEWKRTYRTRHENAVKIFGKLRGEHGLSKRPATAELLDWVRCLGTVFEADSVDKAINTQAGRIKADEPVDWSSLPGLTCLVKLREDLETLGAQIGQPNSDA